MLSYFLAILVRGLVLHPKSDPQKFREGHRTHLSRIRSRMSSVHLFVRHNARKHVTMHKIKHLLINSSHETHLQKFSHTH
jgi:hypothetical protein